MADQKVSKSTPPKDEKPPEKTPEDANADARNATAGQGHTANVPLTEEQKIPPSDTISEKELADSKQPKAPEKPLSTPQQDDPVGTGFDDTKPAEAGDKPGPEAVTGDKK